MRAAIVTEVGNQPSVGDVDQPEAVSGKALLKVQFGALNPIEIRVAGGRMQPPQTPYVPGLEGVGTVERGTRFPPGTRVRFEMDLPGFGKHGALAEYAIADEEAMVELPPAVDGAVAAAAGVVGITALLSLRRALLMKGERVVVLGATGAVGQMAVQLARRNGAAKIVGVGRDQAILERVIALGADSTVSLNEVEGDGLVQAITDAAGGPVDVVMDTLWGAPAMAALRALGPEGRLVNVGNPAGTDVALPLQAMRQARSAVIGLSSGWAPPEAKVDAYEEVLEGIIEGDVTVDHDVAPLAQIADAWQRQTHSPNRKLVMAL